MNKAESNAAPTGYCICVTVCGHLLTSTVWSLDAASPVADQAIIFI